MVQAGKHDDNKTSATAIPPWTSQQQRGKALKRKATTDLQCRISKIPSRGRKGLVRRTHSPKTVPSPIYSPSPARLPGRELKDETSTQSDIADIGFEEEQHKFSFVPSPLNLCGSAGSLTDHAHSVEVRLLPPTVQGVSEAARVVWRGVPSCQEKKTTKGIRAVPTGPAADQPSNKDFIGIVAFPSETVYSLGCKAGDSQALNQLLAIKGFCAQQGVVPSFSLNTHPDKLVDFPVLNVVSLKKARELVKFNHPKRYALIDRETEDGRKSSSSSDKTEQSIDSTSEGTEGITSDVEKGAMKRHLSSNIVFKFSEGRVVFDRIAAAFWPGSLVIVVTAASEKHFLSGFLSKEILLNPKGTDGLEKTLPYVALGCPSHPLSKRFLNEVGVPVISFPITGPSQHFCTKSKQVQNLFSAKNTGANETRVIPCIDGEDKREAFTVPTCVQSEPGPVVLLNENARIVHILRPGVKISKSSLQTALAGHKQQASSALPSITEQVIRAVLRKWQIVEN